MTMDETSPPDDCARTEIERKREILRRAKVENRWNIHKKPSEMKRIATTIRAKMKWKICDVLLLLWSTSFSLLRWQVFVDKNRRCENIKFGRGQIFTICRRQTSQKEKKNVQSVCYHIAQVFVAWTELSLRCHKWTSSFQLGFDIVDSFLTIRSRSFWQIYSWEHFDSHKTNVDRGRRRKCFEFIFPNIEFSVIEAFSIDFSNENEEETCFEATLECIWSSAICFSFPSLNL